MALLASKSQYSHNPPPSNAVHYFPPGASSPTNTDFSENTVDDEVKSWDEHRVCDWLRSINCGGYDSIFQKNNVTGETLLDMDQSILKQLGITKIGDRVRIYAAIKNLRAKINVGAAKKRNRLTLQALDSVASFPSMRDDHDRSQQNYTTSTRNAHDPSFSLSLRGEDSPNNDRSGQPRSGSKVAVSPMEQATRNQTAYFNNNNGNNGPSSAGLHRPSTPSNDTLKPTVSTAQATSSLYTRQHQRAQPSVDGGIMSMENVKQNCVKFIGSEGSTRIVTISGAHTADAILRKALKKFGFLNEEPSNWSVYVTADNSTRFLSDAEIVKICHDVSRAERERLILRPRKNGQPSPPSVAEYRRAQDIAREQAETARQQTQQFANSQQLSPDMVPNAMSRGKVEKFLGEKFEQPSSPAKSDMQTPRLELPSGSPEPSLYSGSVRGSPKLKDFFGQRPPSELISSNLSEYFPDHESRVLERTVRNSVRRSRRMSRMSRISRMSTASSTMSFNDFSDAPPVPSVGDAWLTASAAAAHSIVDPKKKRPMSLLKMGRTPSTYSDDGSGGLSPLAEVPTPRMPKKQSFRRSASTLSVNSVSSRKSTNSVSSRKSTQSINSTSPTFLNGDDDEPQTPILPEDDVDSPVAQQPAKNMFATPTSHHNLLMQLLNYEDEEKEEDEEDEEDEGDTITASDSVSVSDKTRGQNDEEEEEDDEEEYDEEEDEDESEEEEEGDANYHESTNGMKWIKGQLIGQGSFGSVFLALDAMSGILMAVKQVEMPSNNVQGEGRKKTMLDALEREIALLKELQHDNIVQYLGSSSDPDHLNIFLEYVPGGSVAAMLNQYGPLPEPLIKNFVRQILIGLNYLHAKDIIHRDIKGANVLVDNKGGIKISDFGISKKVEAGLLSQAMTHRVSMQGSVFWMAPEVVKQTAYTRKADIWSLGCLIVEMFTGSHPFPDCSQLQAIFKIGSGTTSPTIPSKCSPDAKAFLERTFEIDHHKRPTAEELLIHPFMKMAI